MKRHFYDKEFGGAFVSVGADGTVLSDTTVSYTHLGGDDSLDLLSGFWYAGVSELVANGQVRAIDDLLASSGQGIQEIFEEYPEILHCGRINGKQYGIPSVCAWTCENCYLVMEDIVKKANIEFPEKIANLDELTLSLIHICVL